MQFFYVYAIVSCLDERIRYTGVTQKLKARLTKHNGGRCPYTSKFRPWRLDVAVAFRSEAKARAFERYPQEWFWTGVCTASFLKFALERQWMSEGGLTWTRFFPSKDYGCQTSHRAYAGGPGRILLVRS